MASDLINKFMPPPDVDTSEAVEYLQLKPHHCRAILDERGADGLPLSCGHMKLKFANGTYASSYCPNHAERFQPGHFKVRL